MTAGVRCAGSEHQRIEAGPEVRSLTGSELPEVIQSFQK